MSVENKPRLAVHKFSSCDGCQLALLNMGQDLITLAERVDVVHFAEAGVLADGIAQADVAIVEGSVSTESEKQRIREIRQNSKTLVSIGACATSGGLQALRNLRYSEDWLQQIYPDTTVLDSLKTSTALSQHVRVDYQLWGCPITGRQVLMLLNSLLLGVRPSEEKEKICLECKRRQTVCTLVTKAEPCMGPVTRTGCGALCPHVGRACYGCFGPAENPNTRALSNRLSGFGLQTEEVVQRFQLMQCNSPEFRQAAAQLEHKHE